MKKAFLIALLSVSLAVPAIAQNGNLVSQTLVYLGLSGGYYVTEVKIPIQQIRYQNPTTGQVSFIDYVKTIETLKYAPPYISEGVNYSLYTDPVSGIYYIRLRPLTKLVGRNGTGPVLHMTPANPFPIQFNTNAISNSTSRAVTTTVGLANTIDKTETVSSATGSVTTVTNTITTPTNVAAGTASTVDAKTHSTATALLNVIPDIDLNAPAILSANATSDSGNFLSVNDYLFVPEGGKMPNFSQQMIHQWFFSGPLSVLVRIRPKVKAFENLPEIEGGLTSTGLNLGFVTGTKHNLSVGKKQYYTSPLVYQFPLFMVGINSTDITRRKDSDNDGLADTYGDKESQAVFSMGTGVGIQYGSIGIMALVGSDHLFGSARRAWAYQGKLWFGFSLGISLDKLVGLSK